MRKITKKWITLTLGLCLFIGLTALFTGFASRAQGEQRVFDEAGLLTETEIAALEETVAGLRTDWDMDLVLVTCADAQGKSTRDFADDYYEAGGFGTKNHSGVLFLIDMDNRELTISTEGDMIRYLTDARIENVLDAAYEGAADGDYYRAFADGIEAIDRYVKAGIMDGQYNYDEETGKTDYYVKRSVKWYEALLALVAAGAAGIIPCVNIKHEYGMKEEAKLAERSMLAYRQNCDFAYGLQTDHLINTAVTHRIIPRETTSSGGSSRSGSSSAGRSTTHHSSSGRSHGGGSRKF